MDENKNFLVPIPIVNRKEASSLDALTGRYNKLVEPSKIAKIGKKAGEIVPEKVKVFGSEMTEAISAQEIYKQTLELIADGFKVVEEQSAKFSISEKTIIKKVNSVVLEYEITDLSEICFARSYKLSKLVSSYKSQDTLAALCLLNFRMRN